MNRLKTKINGFLWVFFVGLNYNYIGRCPANIGNGFDLPGYGLLDVSAGYTVSKQLALQFNVNNLLNTAGINGFLGPGGFPAALNTESFTRDFVTNNPTAVYITSRVIPRGLFATLTYQFR